jgi:hypothetical protein
VAREPAVAVGLLWLTSQVIMGLIGGVLFLLARRTVSAATSAGDERR